MINRYQAVVESFDRRSSCPWLRLGRGRLAARMWPGLRVGQKVTVRIRPEDVLLCVDHPGRVSARNILAGHVRKVKHVPEGIYVTMHVGFPLTALITRRAATDLEVRRGTGLFAVVKATAIVPEADSRAALRISIVGRKGPIGPDKIDFLKAIDLTGSLSAAARESGVTYRTAWLWAEAVNRAWGEPLVARSQGGRGGGGAVLTPQARALLDRAARAERQILK